MHKDELRLLLLIFLHFLTSSRAESELSCVFTESCLLPCGFPPGDDAVIHWIRVRTDGETQVHSYYQNRDQLGNQDPAFRGRTSLFGGQIPGGNASLLLGGVRVQDGGRYHCFISTVAGSYEDCVVLRVDAPVKAVRIHREGNSITCSSSWIYPEPELRWASSPPSSSSLQSQPRVQRTQQHLYNISSSLLLPDGGADGSYSCTVSTASSSRTQTLVLQGTTDGGGDQQERSQMTRAAILGGFLVTLAVIIIIIVVWKWKKRKTETVQTPETEQL